MSKLTFVCRVYSSVNDWLTSPTGQVIFNSF